MKLYLNKSLTEILKLTMKQENIDLFENYNMINLKLENLINPYFVNIEEDNKNDNEEEEIIN